MHEQNKFMNTMYLVITEDQRKMIPCMLLLLRVCGSCKFIGMHSELEQWIRLKYDRKQFMKKGAVPSPSSAPAPSASTSSSKQTTSAPNHTRDHTKSTPLRPSSTPASTPKATSFEKDLLQLDTPQAQIVDPFASTHQQQPSLYQHASITHSAPVSNQYSGNAQPAAHSANGTNKEAILQLYNNINHPPLHASTFNSTSSHHLQQPQHHQQAPLYSQNTSQPTQQHHFGFSPVG
jgi:hypothetical protein